MSHYTKLRNHLLAHQYTWLITGVAGFIGSNLMEALLKLNQTVIGLDNFANGYQKNIDEVLASVTSSQRKNFTFYQSDIRNQLDCEQAVEGVDFVLHQAALGSIPRSIANPQLVNEVNVTGFVNMLVAAKNAKVKRFVFASSSSVYGDSPILPKVELQIGNPLSPYATTKCANELYAKAFANCYEIETIGLRYFNVFGPRQNFKNSYAAVIPIWINSLIKNEPVFINGDGETSRDFCFVENAIQANLLAATTLNRDALNTVYNVAVGDRTTLNMLYEMMCQKLNLNHKAKYREFRDGDIRHSLADISKIKNQLGYQPEYIVDTGLSLTVNYFQYTHQQDIKITRMQT